MDQAIYEPSLGGFIYGVRGQWLMKFNSTTGALVSSLRVFKGMGGISTLTAIGGIIYVGTEWTPNNNLSLGSPFVGRDIYKVDVATFTVTGGMGLAAKATYSFGDRVNSFYASGWHTFTTDDVSILGLVDTGDIFQVDPTNIPGYNNNSFGLAADVAYDVVNDVIWLADPGTPNIWVFSIDFLSSAFDTNGNLQGLSGICHNTAQNKVYAVKGDTTLYHFDAGTAVPAFTNFAVASSIIPVATANPYRIKSVNGQVGNPLNGKILIPCWGDANGAGPSDSVVVWDPATDTISGLVRDGFTSPIDIVVTPTKNWAVQSGTTGLREIV